GSAMMGFNASIADNRGSLPSLRIARNRSGVRTKRQSALFADQLKPLVLSEDGDAELFGLAEFGSGARTRHHVVGLLRHRAGGLGAEPFRHGLGLVAPHLLDPPRDDH